MSGVGFFLIPSLLVGAWLLVSGWRGRRLEGVIECSRCGFDLLGLPGVERCPECGGNLLVPGSSRVRRVRRRGRIAAGVIAVLFGISQMVVLGSQMVARINFTENAPVWWLRFELGKVSASRSAEVGAELDRRLRGAGGSMTLREAQEVADDLSELLANPSVAWNPGWSNFYERARLRALVSDAQWMQYCERALVISWRPPGRVRSGSDLAMKSAIRGVGLADSMSTPMIRYRARLESVSFDGRPVADFPHAETGSFVDSHESTWTTKVRAPTEIGTARIKVRYRLDIVTSDAEPRLVGSLARDFDTEIEVVGKDETTLSIVRDESLAAPIASAISINQVRISEQHMIGVELKVRNCPTDLGLELILRPRDGAYAGQEVPLGSITLASRATVSFHFGSNLSGLGGADATTVDIILRPSVSAAEKSPDLTSVWLGPDVVIENASVLREPTEPDAGGAIP